MNKWIMAGTAAAFTGAAAFARSEYERTHLDIVHYDIKTDKLGLEWNGFKAVFLSDLHDNSFGMENEELLAAIEKEQPDIVVIGGDMLVVKEWAAPHFDLLANLYKKLVKRYPVYYAFGNHEQRMKEEPLTYPGWWQSYWKVLKDSGMHVLVNKSEEIIKNGTAMRISGITLPRLHITLPYRVQQMVVCSAGMFRAFAWITFSISALEMPMALMGYAALSVDRQTMRRTPAPIAAVSTLSVPSTLVRTASMGKNSQEGTCLSAAA